MISKSLNIISTYIWDPIFSIKTFVQFCLCETQNFDSVCCIRQWQYVLSQQRLIQGLWGWDLRMTICLIFINKRCNIFVIQNSFVRTLIHLSIHVIVTFPIRGSAKLKFTHTLKALTSEKNDIYCMIKQRYNSKFKIQFYLRDHINLKQNM